MPLSSLSATANGADRGWWNLRIGLAVASGGSLWLGAAITGLAFAVGRWALGFYLTHSGVANAFQAAGALAVLLIAVYYLAQIFLFGAVFTRVYAAHFGSKREG